MENYRRALEIREQLSAADPKNSEARRDLATSFDKVGEMLTRLDQPVAAIQYFRRALAIDEALSAAEPNNAQPRLDRAHDHEQISEALAKSGDLVAAMAERRRAADLQQAVSKADPANEEVKRDLAASQAQLGEWTMALAEKPNRRQIELWREARAWFGRSIDYWNGLRAQRTLESAEAETAQKIAAAIAKCDQALAKLKAQPAR
jgi:tetratricopeptide (TPR) repeat protein